MTDPEAEVQAQPEPQAEAQPQAEPQTQLPKRRKPGAGRKSEFRHRHLALVEQLVGDGLHLTAVAKRLGVGRTTFYLWRQQFPMLNEAITRGEEAQNDAVENSLYKRATGTYRHKTTKVMQYQGKVLKVPVTEKLAPDVEAAKYWLNNRRPERWKNRVENEFTGAAVIFQSSILPTYACVPVPNAPNQPESETPAIPERAERAGEGS